MELTGLCRGGSHCNKNNFDIIQITTLADIQLNTHSLFLESVQSKNYKV